MSATQEPTKASFPQPSINYTLAASLLATGLDREQVARQVGAKNWATLKVGLQRRGITITQIRTVAAQTMAGSRTVTGAVADARDSSIRDMVKAAVREALADPELRDLPLAGKGQGRADVLHKLAQTAAVAEDWAGDRVQTVVGLSVTGTLDGYETLDLSQSVTPGNGDSAQVVDVQSEPES